jgi:hypothetical protein
MKEQTRKDMQQKLADYRQPAPDISWGELEKALAENKKTSGMPLWGKRWAAAAVVITMVGLGWLMWRTNPSDEQGQVASSISSTKTEPQKTISEIIEQEETESIEPVRDNKGASPTHLPNNLMTSVVTTTKDKAVEKEVMPSTAVTEEEETVQQTETSTSPTQQDAGQQKSVDNKPQTTEQKRIVRPSDFQLRSAPLIKNRLAAKIYVSNLYESGVERNRFMGGNLYAGFPGEQDKDNNEKDDNHADNKEKTSALSRGPHIRETLNDGEEEFVSNHIPIRFGVSLRYQLSQRWSLETGLSYTYISSDIRSRYPNLRSEQKLTYIGIPVSAEYIFWNNKRFNIYASAGTIVEKMVRGRRYYKNWDRTDKLSVKPLQFSVDCGVGAELKFNNMLSIYAEPGLTYHFDNHSDIPTHYMDKPLEFSMDVGLRINFNKK